ncbi:MAG: hypothetical protein R3B11_02840 [Nitrospira sp.]|nr:hypothetical protein [Nitrospira sp.]MDR4474926.1 hypothetical protein [Nitrospira sp.]
MLAYHPKKKGADRVWAVSCKSWQACFNPAKKVVSGREAWKGFRELTSPKWSEAFIEAVAQATGQSSFTYFTAVTKLVGDVQCWEENPAFSKTMDGNPIKILQLREMLTEIYSEIGTTLAGTELGRTLQLFRAAGGSI